MSNPYISYYENQVGSGIPGFKGLRNQKGYGFISSLISKTIVPLFKSISSVNPSNIIKMAADTLKGPVADDIARLGGTATGSLIKSLQKGSGRKYKRRKPKKKVAHKRRRVSRQHCRTSRRRSKKYHKRKVKKRKLKKRTKKKRKSRTLSLDF